MPIQSSTQSPAPLSLATFRTIIATASEREAAADHRQTRRKERGTEKVAGFAMIGLLALTTGCSAPDGSGSADDSYGPPDVTSLGVSDNAALNVIAEEESAEAHLLDPAVTEEDLRHEVALGALAAAEQSGPDSTETSGDVRQVEQEQNYEAVRVLTQNVWVKDWTSSRRARLFAWIRSLNPDVIGLQEVTDDSWDDISSEFSDYHRWFKKRSLGTEGVALLVRAGRFDFPTESKEKTFTTSQQFFECGDVEHNRNIIYFKVRDKRTDRTLDIFNTHFPKESAGWCLQREMAKKVANWVEDYGDNILVMGDFNTGWDREGDLEAAMEKLYDSSSVDLDDVIRTANGGPFDSNDSIITGNSDPAQRFGRMIDHVMMGPAFVLDDAKIDRTLFSGNTRVFCEGDTNMRANSNDTRNQCKVNGTWTDVEDMQKYSDHWGVWADVRRINCPDGC